MLSSSSFFSFFLLFIIIIYYYYYLFFFDVQLAVYDNLNQIKKLVYSKNYKRPSFAHMYMMLLPLLITRHGNIKGLAQIH